MEKFLIKKYEKSFIAACQDGQFAEMNTSVFVGRTVSPAEIIEACETLPFMSDKKLVVVRDSGLFSASRKNDGEKAAEYFAERFAGDSDGVVLLFVENDADKRLKAYKTLEKHGKATAFEPMKESRLVTWVLDELRKNGLTASSAEAVYLIRVTGGSMERADMEIEKLSAYKTEGRITRDDIDAICSKTSESRVFDLTDAIAAKDRTKAIMVYNELLEMKEQPVGVLAMLGRHFRMMLKCRLFAENGAGLSEITSQLGGSPYAVKISYNQSRNFDAKLLENAVIDCVECDTRIKTGLIDARLGVEMLVVKYT